MAGTLETGTNSWQTSGLESFAADLNTTNSVTLIDQPGTGKALQLSVYAIAQLADPTNTGHYAQLRWFDGASSGGIIQLAGDNTPQGDLNFQRPGGARGKTAYDLPENAGAKLVSSSTFTGATLATGAGTYSVLAFGDIIGI